MSSLELTLSKILKLGKLRHPASDYLGEHQKQNFLFHLREILSRAKSENVKKIFCFWCPPSPRGGWRGVLRADTLLPNYHALRAWAFLNHEFLIK